MNDELWLVVYTLTIPNDIYSVGAIQSEYVHASSQEEAVRFVDRKRLRVKGKRKGEIISIEKAHISEYVSEYYNMYNMYNAYVSAVYADYNYYNLQDAINGAMVNSTLAVDVDVANITTVSSY